MIATTISREVTCFRKEERLLTLRASVLAGNASLRDQLVGQSPSTSREDDLSLLERARWCKTIEPFNQQSTFRVREHIRFKRMSLSNDGHKSS